MLNIFTYFFCSCFIPAPPSKSEKDCIREAKAMRAQLPGWQIDKTLQDSFPASDPPGWY